MAEQHHDLDPQETREWLEALDGVLANEGAERAHFLVEQLVDHARQDGVNIPYTATTAYINTVPAHLEAKSPGNHAFEERIRSYTRWNAAAMVVKANKPGKGDPGGHITSFASAATLYDVGWNHFWHAPSDNHGGDLVYFQGHCAPGMYSRAFLEGRITEDQLDKFRKEVDGGGLSSYPHPWLMPNFWQFPTVSMGLGPIMAIYQARFMKYLGDRGFEQKGDRKVWCFCGDGEMDEPESLGAISLAGRENLDNLIFVINCNLQRLDGPVRGNSKIIQELEGDFRGSGWNVIKVVWGSGWDALLAKDEKGLLQRRMMEVVDGEYQTYKSKDGAYVREHFFNSPELKALVSNMSDDDIWRLTRGGNDPHKVYAGYKAAVEHKGQPTLLLVKTVKGYGMGAAGESQNVAHQTKKLSEDDLLHLRDRFKIPLTDEEAKACKFYAPPADAPELKYMHERRAALGGYLPARKPVDEPLQVPGLDAFKALLDSSGERESSTTMAFVRLLGTLVKDKNIGKRVVPIVPDESRTFGMEGMFRQLGIWSHVGQLYAPEDADQLMFYKESTTGQILQEGINEAGAMSDWIAAATAYANHGVTMIPFYIYYSMFGFQRIGDLAWAAGDLRARGFLLGGTAGRTTLNGEGLQHQDGHTQLFAEYIPNCVSYDPTFAYELAVIVQDGMKRMYQDQENIYYYLTLMNENYAHPAMPEGAEAGILKGLYKFRQGDAGKLKVQLMGSGTIFREVIAAADLLKADFGVDADIWSATSFNELRRDGVNASRYNLLHPTAEQHVPYVTQCLKGAEGPVIAATDYKRTFADQIREYVPNRYVVLGTDGYGRSDSRDALRSFFEVDRFHVAVAALKALADDGKIGFDKVAEAIAKYGINADRPAPWTV
ncbi:pyruvate dehydrogenase (acetyl-transferring), homodimeric type [Jeongeupia chitinilytica]|uniref:Pyruvate dehydrogenase E1 component n=1 Tax=Jeongeupia chitinilytica TaxID=1041641 RepID=A0ABQ3GWU7_9NEIS|nr:pyruvate dehydrogenase (acetyl-transferring), homodimeric type [Jeongeupia chitinilytica]GHD56304.1 pyruvate dehydrogenase E1 component [Jeongeupia chitinilytica]